MPPPKLPRPCGPAYHSGADTVAIVEPCTQRVPTSTDRRLLRDEPSMPVRVVGLVDVVVLHVAVDQAEFGGAKRDVRKSHRRDAALVAGDSLQSGWKSR
jgi:hypothetical protein